MELSNHIMPCQIRIMKRNWCFCLVLVYHAWLIGFLWFLIETYYGETDRYLKIRSGEHIGISPLTFKKVKPSVEISIRDHLLFCNHDPSFGDFTILSQGTHKFLLEIKESLLIKLDKSILNKSISSAPLFLFDKV